MKVICLTKSNQAEVVKTALAVLKNGGVIVYPTETAYGLGADFFNPKAVKNVYQIKGRNYRKPLSVIVSSLVMAKRLAKFDEVSQQLAKKHWPGPLTLIQKSKIKNQNYSSKFKTLGLRVSSNKFATAIVKKLNRPLTATSANLAGAGEFYSAQLIIKQFAGKKHQPDLVIDAGRLPKVKVSTIARVSRGKIEVLRPGVVKV